MSLTFREARPGDEPLVARAVRGIAEAEGLSHKVVATHADYARLMFGPDAVLRGLVAERACETIGLALWHPIVMTYAGRVGLYIEDVFVEPACRGQGCGRAIFAELARRATQGGYERLQWSVKNDNVSAVGFYERLGAEAVDGFTTLRLSGGALRSMAGH